MSDVRDTTVPEDDVEVVDALPVLADSRPRGEEPVPGAPAPSRSLLASTPVAVTAAAVAATGFVAGAATVAVARRRRARVAAKPRAKDLGEVVLESRRFVIDMREVVSR